MSNEGINPWFVPKSPEPLKAGGGDVSSMWQVTQVSASKEWAARLPTWPFPKK
jgi:hypothetical protein